MTRSAVWPWIVPWAKSSNGEYAPASSQTPVHLILRKEVIFNYLEYRKWVILKKQTKTEPLWTRSSKHDSSQKHLYSSKRWNFVYLTKSKCGFNILCFWSSSLSSASHLKWAFTLRQVCQFMWSSLPHVLYSHGFHTELKLAFDY